MLLANYQQVQIINHCSTCGISTKPSRLNFLKAPAIIKDNVDVSDAISRDRLSHSLASVLKKLELSQQPRNLGTNRGCGKQQQQNECETANRLSRMRKFWASKTQSKCLVTHSLVPASFKNEFGGYSLGIVSGLRIFPAFAR